MNNSMVVSLVIGASLGKDYFSTLDTVEQRAKKMGAALTETNKKLAAAKELIKYRETLEALKEKQAQLGTSSARLDRGIAEVEARYRKAKAEARAYGLAVGNVVAEQKKLEAESERMQKRLAAQANMRGAETKMGELRGKMLGAAAAMYGMGRMVGSAMEREEAGLYLRTVINSQDKDAALRRSLDHARKFAANSLATDTEILKIEYQLNSAGLSEDLARAGTEAIHKVAKVTRGDSELVAEIMGVTFNNLGAAMGGTDKEKFKQIGNILTKTQFKYQIRDFAQLGDSMKYGAAAAASYKVPLEQTATIIGQLNSAGLQGSMAGTAFNGVLRNMGKASEALNFEIIRGVDGQMDMIATLEGLNEQLDGLDTDERAARIQELFGDEGMRGLVPLLGNLKQLKEGLKEVSAAGKSGLVDNEYSRFLDSASGQTKMFRQNLAQIGAVFATTLLPGINVVARGLAKLFTGVAWLLEKCPVLSWILAGLAAGFATAGVAIGVMTAATWLWNAALAANPIVWIIGAIAGLIAMVYLLWKNWDKVWDWIKDKAVMVGGVIKKVFDQTPMGMAIRAGKWVGEKTAGWFGHKETAGEVAAAPVSAPPIPAMAQSGTANSTVNAPITINAAPGQSSEDIARTVSRELDARQRASAAQQRARLYDS